MRLELHLPTIHQDICTSNVGIGLDPHGFSSSLDLMKTFRAFCSDEEHSGAPSGDPNEILSSEGSEDAETSPPCGASL